MIKTTSMTLPVPLRPSTRGNKSAIAVEPNDSLGHESKPKADSRKRTRDGNVIGAVSQLDESSKTVNGLGKNGVLQPSPDIMHEATAGAAQPSKSRRDETRSLRSKDGGSRLKSDLATYFPNFEDIIAGAPQESEYLKVNEPIQITNIPLENTSLPVESQLAPKPTSSSPQFEVIDIRSLGTPGVPPSDTDPLDDSVYLPTHKKAERREKQLKNIEKERAQHEKGQLETLLDSLQGPEWLRAMGVTGVTDGARKEYEPKRDYFIREVKVLLNKFRTWKEAEKRLQAEKAAREESDDEHGDEDADGGAEGYQSESEASHIGDSDVDGWAARQLRDEAKTARPKRQRKILPPKPPEPPKPFTSFFEKPHLRAAAMGRAGRSTRRIVLAFGHAIPEMPEREFELPPSLLTEEVLKANARKRRRMNREKKEEK